MALLVSEIGIEDSVKAVARALRRFAAPEKIPFREPGYNTRRIGDIEITFDLDVAGLAKFRFVTRDNIEVTVAVQFLTLDKALFDKTIHNVALKIDQHRFRRNMNPLSIILPNQKRLY